jgi:hypothetical protein
MKNKLIFIILFCFLVNCFSFIGLLDVNEDNLLAQTVSSQSELFKYLPSWDLSIVILNKVIENFYPVSNASREGKKPVRPKNGKNHRNSNAPGILADTSGSKISKLMFFRTFDKGFPLIARSRETQDVISKRAPPGLLYIVGVLSLTLFVLLPRRGLPDEAVFSFGKNKFTLPAFMPGGFFISYGREIQ